MKRARLAAVVLLAVLTGAGTAHPAAVTLPLSATQCHGGERVVYSCRFGAKIGSVCLGTNSIHYRFGPSARPELDLSSTPDWSNIHIGGNRSQGGLNQDFIRFSSHDTHYVVHSDETGSLNERPGRVTSGIVILRGDSAEDEIGRLECKSHASFNDKAFNSISGAAPEGWDGQEPEGGPFEAVY